MCWYPSNMLRPKSQELKYFFTVSGKWHDKKQLRELWNLLHTWRKSLQVLKSDCNLQNVCSHVQNCYIYFPRNFDQCLRWLKCDRNKTSAILMMGIIKLWFLKCFKYLLFLLKSHWLVFLWYLSSLFRVIWYSV